MHTVPIIQKNKLAIFFVYLSIILIDNAIKNLFRKDKTTQKLRILFTPLYI